MFEQLELAGAFLFTPKKWSDDRGFFCETYNAGTWEAAGLRPVFVQDNHSFSRDVGTIRGLHFQKRPMAQDKLVRVTAGRIIDVIVDLRRASPTYGQHVAVELSRENWRQLFVPVGFAHGFVTLEPNTEVLYKVSNLYSAEHDAGLAWDDPDLAIAWGIDVAQAVLSDKDRRWPRLKDLPELF